MPPGPALSPAWTKEKDVKPKDAPRAMSGKHNDAFIKIMEDYSDVIIMTYTGHYHSDSFNLYYDDAGKYTIQFRSPVPSRNILKYEVKIQLDYF